MKHLDPIFATIAPGVDSAPRTPGKTGTATHGGERLPALRPERRRSLREDGAQRDRVRAHGRVRRGSQHPPARQRRQAARARSTPRRHRCGNPELYQYDIDIPAVAEVWRRGSVVASWLLDLAAHALQRVAGARRLRGSRVRLRRGALDGPRGRRRGRAGARARRRRCTTGSRRAARPTSPTRSSRRCARSSAATTRSRSELRQCRRWRRSPFRPTRWCSSARPATSRTRRSSRRCTT